MLDSMGPLCVLFESFGSGCTEESCTQTGRRFFILKTFLTQRRPFEIPAELLTALDIVAPVQGLMGNVLSHFL